MHDIWDDSNVIIVDCGNALQVFHYNDGWNNFVEVVVNDHKIVLSYQSPFDSQFNSYNLLKKSSLIVEWDSRSPQITHMGRSSHDQLYHVSISAPYNQRQYNRRKLICGKITTIDSGGYPRIIYHKNGERISVNNA